MKTVSIVFESHVKRYPAVHVYIYVLLHWVTDHGKDIFTAQLIFTAVYLLNLCVVMLCYRSARCPVYVYPLLILSKRLHSIYILRLFNDCFTSLFQHTAIYMFIQRQWTFGTIFYSLAVGVKMNALLMGPAVAILMLKFVQWDKSIRMAVLFAESQVWVFL